MESSICFLQTLVSRLELTQWMMPELRPAAVAPATAANAAVKRLHQIAPAARSWFFEMPNDRAPYINAYFRGAPEGPSFGHELLDPATGAPAQVRETRGADSLYYFHFDLLMPSFWGRLLVGFCAVATLVAIVSGIITHRAIFRDFFTFRPRKGQRSWLDAHNAIGVLTLPFFIFIVYSGIVTLLPLYMPWGIKIAFPDNRAFFDDLGYQAEAPAPAGRPAPLVDLSKILAQTAAHWNGSGAERISIDNPGDANARITVYRSKTDILSHRAEWMLFDGVSGEVLRATGATGAAAKSGAVIYGIHTARFADQTMRFLFFVSGLLGCAVIATGLILWTVKRRHRLPDPARPPFGFKLVERLNVATVAGLPVAIAVLFWANRLFPVGMAARGNAEIDTMLLTWLGLAIWSAVRPVQKAWREVLWAAAALYAGLPFLNVLATERHLGRSLTEGDLPMALVDVSFLAVGITFAATVLWLARRNRSEPA